MAKKTLLTFILSALIILMPILATAAIVECTDDCTIDNFFSTFDNVYDIIVNQIAAPLATISITVGAIMMMVSAGNPNLMSVGKKIFWSGIIGLALAYASLAIVNFLLGAVGYSG